MHYPPAPLAHANVIALPPSRPNALFHPPAAMRDHRRDYEIEQLRRERDAAHARLAAVETRLRRLHLASGDDDLDRLLTRTERALAIQRHHRAAPLREHSALHRAEAAARGEHTWPVRFPTLTRLWDHLLTIAARSPIPANR